MGGVNDKNIEKWLFDWKEGNLNLQETEALQNFLIQNPEFTIDQDAWADSHVQILPKAVYANKSALIKKKKSFYPVAIVASLLFLIGGATGVYFYKHNSDLEFHQLEGEMLGLLSNENDLSMLDAISFSFIENDKVNEGSLLNNHKSNSNKSIFTNKIQKDKFNDITDSELVSLQATSTTTIIEVANSSDEGYSSSEEFLKNGNSLKNADILNNDHTANIESDQSVSSELKESNVELSEDEMAHNEIAKSELKFKTSKFKRFIAKFKNAMKRGTGIVNLRETDMVIAGYNHLDFNPAFSGSGYNTKVQTQAYGRWLNSENSLVGMNLSADSYVHGMRSAVGIQANYENYGVGMYQNASVSLYFSPKINISKSITLEPAVKFTIGQRWMNESKITSGNEIELVRGSLIKTFNVNESPNGTKAWYKDLGVGLNLNTKWFNASVSVDQILRHKTGVYSNNDSDRSSVNITASVGTNYQSYNKKWVISPFIAYKKHDENNEMWFGTGARWKWLTFGTGISTKADIAANIGFKVKSFQMFYQYELVESNLRSSKMNAHQLTLRFNSRANRSASRIVNL